MQRLILLSSSVLPLHRHCNPPCRKSRPKGHVHPHEPISFWTCTVYTGPREMWNLLSLNTIHVIRSLSIQLPIFFFMRYMGILAFGRLVLEFWNHRPFDICVAVIRNLNGKNPKSVACEMQLQVQTHHLARLSRGEFWRSTCTVRSYFTNLKKETDVCPSSRMKKLKYKKNDI